MRVLKQVEQGTTMRNRNGASTYVTRRFKRTVGKTTWFRPGAKEVHEEVEIEVDYGSRSTRRRRKDNQRYIEAVTFVPYTPEGRLRQELMKMEEGLGFRTRRKYVEMQGRTVGESLIRKDPNPVECGRRECFCCRSAPGACSRQGAVYMITCTKCKATGVDTAYYGESARTLYDRGEEHLRALECKSMESPLWEHHLEAHGDQEDPHFEMKPVTYAASPLVRQCLEARMILDNAHKNLMNRRGEWGQNLPPKLTIEDETGAEPVGAKRRKEQPVEQKAKRARKVQGECKETGGQGDKDDPPQLHKGRVQQKGTSQSKVQGTRGTRTTPPSPKCNRVQRVQSRRTPRNQCKVQ